MTSNIRMSQKFLCRFHVNVSIKQHGRVSMPQHVRGKLVNYQLAPFASGAVLAAGAFIQIIHESCPRADIGHSRPQMAVRIRTDQSSF